MNKIVIRALVFLAIAGVLVAGGFIYYDYSTTLERFPKNSYIGRVDVSSLNRVEAVERLDSSYVDEVCPDTITLFYRSSEMRFLPSELGLEIDAQTSVSQAFSSLKAKAYFKQLASRLRQPGQEQIFPIILTPDKYILAEFLDDLSHGVKKIPRDASIRLMGKGAYIIEKEIWGAEVDAEKSIERVAKSLQEGQSKIELAAKLYEPRVKYEDLASHPPVTLLSKYQTFYGTHDSPNRIHNIKMIAGKITGSILLPEENFSLLNKIGKFDKESGFKEAYVITQGVLEPQLGGGSCQIGTTLFNSISLADLEVLQRRNHSIYFGIYPLGRDATVYPPALDLRFKNNTGYPIMIQGIATNRSLTFKVYGTKTGSKEVIFTAPVIRYYGANGPIVRGGRPPSNIPFSTTVKRTVKEGGKIIKEELIKSFYKLDGDRSKVTIKRKEPR